MLKNQKKNKMTDKRFWYLVDKIGWHNSDYDIKRLGVLLITYAHNIDEINEMREIAWKKRNDISQSVSDYGCKNPKQHYWGGDDSFWDFTAHIVGMGKHFYEKVKSNVEYISELGDDYRENFEYVFTEAEEFAKTEEGKKTLNKKRKDKLERIIK